MCPLGYNSSIFQDDDLVGIHNRIDPLGNYQRRGISGFLF